MPHPSFFSNVWYSRIQGKDASPPSEEGLHLEHDEIQSRKRTRNPSHSAAEDKPCELALRLELAQEEHLASVAIGACVSPVNTSGRRVTKDEAGDSTLRSALDPPGVIAATGFRGTRLWRLRKTASGLSLKRLILPENAHGTAANYVTVSKDGKLVVVVTNGGDILLLDVDLDAEDIEGGDSARHRAVKIRHVFRHRELVGSRPGDAASPEASMCGVVGRVALSADGMWLAVGDAAENGRVHVYDLDR